MKTKNSEKEKKPSGKMPINEAFKLTMRGYGIWWKNYPMMLVSMAVCAVTEALTPYVGIYLSARIINEIAGNRDIDVLTPLIVTALVSAALLALLSAGLTRWKNCQFAGNSGMWYRHYKLISEKLFSLDFCSIDDSHTHDLLSQIKQNNNSSGWGLGQLLWCFNKLVRAVMSIIGAVALTVTLFVLPVPDTGGQLTILNNPLFVALIIAVMLLVTFISPVFAGKAGGYWVKRAADARMGNRYFSFFGFMGHDRSRQLDIRMYRQDVICKTMMLRKDGFGFDTKSGIAKDARGPMGILYALSSAVSQVFTGIVYVFVCLKAWAGAFGVGSVTQYIGSITALSKGLSSLVTELGTLRNNAPFMKTFFEFMDIPNDMYQGSLTVEKRSDRKYEIEFRDVSFKYSGTEVYALRNISIKFKVGERLAVVGMNGSGKTTFIKLLCRLYDPTEGEILLNGIDIRKYDYHEYMSIYSVVFQDFKLLAYGLGQNVAASMDFNRDKAEKCLTDAGFGDRLNKMTKGLETCLYKDFDKEGVEISGGEAQKIALARTLYKDAPFVVLDEPTAALDPIAEHEVYSKMNDIVGDRTAVFISHRLSSCRFCHDIAVFHEGKLIERGSHDELSADVKSKYYELWNAQAQYYTA